MSVISQVDDAFQDAEIDNSELASNSKINKSRNTGSSSVWPNIMFGTGMAAYLALPPMIPGVTVKGLIVFNVVLINSIYFLAFVAQSIRAIKAKGNRR